MLKDTEKACGWPKSCIGDPILKDSRRYTGNPDYDSYVHIEVIFDTVVLILLHTAKVIRR